MFVQALGGLYLALTLDYSFYGLPKATLAAAPSLVETFRVVPGVRPRLLFLESETGSRCAEVACLRCRLPPCAGLAAATVYGIPKATLETVCGPSPVETSRARGQGVSVWRH